MKPSLKPILMLLVCLFLLGLISASYAEERKDEWKDRNYSFSKMRSILWNPSITATGLDNIRQHIVLDKLSGMILRDDTKKLSQAGLTFISQEELLQRIEKATGENLADLAQTDPAKRDDLIKQYTPIYCTHILQAKVTAYGETQQYVPEHIETYETDKEITVRKTVTDSNGRQVEVNETVTVPVTQTRVVPAHYIPIAHAGIECVMLDAKTNQPVWQMIDIREASYKGPEGMFERIIQRSIDLMKKLKE